LDAVLESLGSQLVPPEFYQTSSDSSLFGSQHSLDNEEGSNAVNRGVFSDPSINRVGNGIVGLSSPVSPSATIRRKDPLSPKLSGNLDLDPISKGKTNRQESRSRSRNEDRSYWKTLRDFVDDKSIEDALDMIEDDRLALDVCLQSSRHYLFLNNITDRPEQNR
jgi:autophagy-related protein 17